MSLWRTGAVTAENKYRIGIACAEWNDKYTDILLEKTIKGLIRANIRQDDIDVIAVPGSLELVFAAQQLLKTEKYDAIIVLGVIIRGETMHFELVAESCASSITTMNEDSDTPVVFGVLACDNDAQVVARLPLGADYANTAIKMANMMNTLWEE